jgi:two-component system OmpR family sensor kinase/two-component system sensor histidine kinase BaeS
MILSYLLVALLTVVVVSALIRFTSGKSFLNLLAEEQTVSLTQQLQEYYTANSSLNGFFDSYSQNAQKFQPNPPQAGDNRNAPSANHDVRGVSGVIDLNNRAVIPTLGQGVGAVIPADRIQKKVAVKVNGQVIAWVIQDSSMKFQLSPEEKSFLKRTNVAIGLAALAGVLAAVGTGFFLASRLLKPIRQLTQASQAMARGDFHQQVTVTSQDELGLLTKTFNQMSADLDQADQQRKRMTADITHDLSTPIQIISGYIEMLEEVEVVLTPQRIEIIKTELSHLRRLVGDLSTLAQVEAGAMDIQLEPVAPRALLDRVYDAFQPIAARQGVNLVLDVAADTPAILVDEGRMVQILKNLLENAMRYTPQGGEIRLTAAVNGQVYLQVGDNGQGIDAEDLPYVFDRFYRADQSRGGNSGKMGLGLAICKALVTAQGGWISAQSAGKNQGTTIMMSFNPAPRG